MLCKELLDILRLMALAVLPLSVTHEQISHTPSSPRSSSSQAEQDRRKPPLHLKLALVVISEKHSSRGRPTHSGMKTRSLPLSPRPTSKSRSSLFLCTPSFVPQFASRNRPLLSDISEQLWLKQHPSRRIVSVVATTRRMISIPVRAREPKSRIRRSLRFLKSMVLTRSVWREEIPRPAQQLEPAGGTSRKRSDSCLRWRRPLALAGSTLNGLILTSEPYPALPEYIHIW